MTRPEWALGRTGRRLVPVVRSHRRRRRLTLPVAVGLVAAGIGMLASLAGFVVAWLDAHGGTS